MMQLSRLMHAVRKRTGVPCLLDRGGDHRATIFVAGTARSGTTWLSELITHKRNIRYIFEPFNAKEVSHAREFGTRRYMRPTLSDDHLRSVAGDVLSGRIRGRWTDRFNTQVVSNRRLVKAIRANLMLGWLRKNFSEMPMVLIFRHPCAVARSYAGHGWQGSLQPLLAQPQLVSDYLHPYLDVIEAAQDAFERAVCIWCIETKVALDQMVPGECHMVFYEELVRNPEGESEKLFSYLGLPRHDPQSTARDRPSRTSRRTSAVATGKDPVTSWVDSLERSRRDRALEIVEKFGLDWLYDRDPMPHSARLTTLRGPSPTLADPSIDAFSLQ